MDVARWRGFPLVNKPKRFVDSVLGARRFAAVSSARARDI